jgi:hypothetical protein
MAARQVLLSTLVKGLLAYNSLNGCSPAWLSKQDDQEGWQKTLCKPSQLDQKLRHCG